MNNHAKKEKISKKASSKNVFGNINIPALQFIKNQIQNVNEELQKIDGANELKKYVTNLNNYIKTINGENINKNVIFYIFSNINAIIIIGDEQIGKNSNKLQSKKIQKNNLASILQNLNPWNFIKNKLSNICSILLTLTTPKVGQFLDS